MNDQDALNIFLNGSSVKDKLAKTYAEVRDMIQARAVSIGLKNNNFTGEVVKGGTVSVKRLRTAVSQPYGTARAAGEGDAVINDGVDVKIDTDREIVEELERKDILKYGVENLIARRKENHSLAVVRELDNAFFVEAQTAATTVDVSAGATLAAKIEILVQRLETLVNDHVDGIDREDMVLTLHPNWFGQLETYFDTLPNPDNGGMNARKGFHRVEVLSSPRQDVDAIVMVRGSVAQPVTMDQYDAARIPLSNAFAVELFYSFGTKAVMPDLIFKAGLDGNISA